MTQPAPPVEFAAPPAAAEAVFGARLELAQRYAGWLGGAAVERGLIGPREVPRLWERHLMNSAVVAELLPDGVRVLDVGSGAGLPGVPLALARPDLTVDLVEPMLRRVAFLTEVVQDLGLDRVRVVRGRAPDVASVIARAAYVTARAVAPLDRLVRWCLPLVEPGGALLAIKGANAAAELDEHRAALRTLGAESAAVHEVGAGSYSTRVIVVRRTTGRARGR